MIYADTPGGQLSRHLAGRSNSNAAGLLGQQQTGRWSSECVVRPYRVNSLVLCSTDHS